MEKYTNPFYDKKNLVRLTHLAKTAYFDLSLWKDLYFMYSPYYHDNINLQKRQSSESLMASIFGGDTDGQKDYLMKRSKQMY